MQQILTNPPKYFALSNKQIITNPHVSLPPVTTMRDISLIPDDEGNMRQYATCFGDIDADKLHHSFTKVVLSCDPNEGGYIVVLVHTPQHQSEFRTQARTSFVRDGDEGWTPLYGEEMLFYAELIFHERLLYGVTDVGGVDVSNFATGVSPSVRVVVPKNPIYDDGGIDDEDSDALVQTILASKHIIKTQRGDILVAWRRCKNHFDSVTTEIQIYQVDLTEGILTEVNNLEDYALFLGQTSCFSTKGGSNLKPNCAYFRKYRHPTRHLCVYDMKMHNFDTDASSEWSSKAPIIPNFRKNSV